MSPDSTPSAPFVSIITIVFNGREHLEKTIQSIIGQTSTNYEYIIIDGGSKDGTQEIIKKYSDKISHWISEPDKGLYDAMNKGLKISKGKYVWFVNAGDEIYDQQTLEKILAIAKEPADIYYGEAMYISGNHTNLGLRSVVTPHQLPENLQWKSMKKGMVVCHQSIIVKKDIADPYNLAHPYCADIDWIIRALKKSKKTVHTHLILSYYLKGGLSDKKRLDSLKDRFKVLSNHFGMVKTIINHFYITTRAIKFRLK